MRIKEIKNIAVSLGVPAERKNKKDLVRAIQKAEGNAECFVTGQSDSCGQNTCLWRPDCN